MKKHKEKQGYMKKLFLNSKIEKKIDLSMVSPMKYFEKDYNSKTSYDYVSQYALITMAGGAGTRLGHDGPKGTFEINFNNSKVSLFEIIIKKLKKIKKESNVYIHWYIMTSINNNDATINYFKEHDYFNYPQNKITFFKQSSLPILDTNGNCVYKDCNKENYLMEPNGNGTIFKSINNCIIEKLEKEKIKYIGIMNIDNILDNIYDSSFIDLMKEYNYEVGAKTAFKSDPLSKDYVYCKYNNKPIMLDYKYITKELSNQMANEKYLYRDINLGMYIFTLGAIKVLKDYSFPYHRAFKKYKFYDQDGNLNDSDQPNSFKFEKFIYDGFQAFDELLLYRVNKDKEFCPIKNKDDIENAKKYLSSDSI